MLSETLNECARLRGLHDHLSHRTLHQFDWFVTEMIFGSTNEHIEFRARYRSIFEKLTGQGMEHLDAWLSEKNVLFIAMEPQEFDERTLNELNYYQNAKTEITLSIDGKPPIKMVDLMGQEPKK